MGKNEQIPNNFQRLSRKERRTIARKQKKELASKSFFERHAKKIYAGAVATVGGALIVGGVIFLRGQDGRTPLPPTATAQQINSEQSQKANLQIIAQEVKRLKIKSNLKEQEMWANSSFDAKNKKISVNEAAEEEVKRRLFETASLIDQSENPYFQSSAKRMAQLATMNKFNVTVVGSIKGDQALYQGKSGEAGGSVHPIIENGNIQYQLSISADELLNDSNALDMALLLVHELEHVDQFIKYEDSSDFSLTPEQKIVDIREHLNKPEIVLNGEIEAHAVEAQALIYQLGIGIKGNVRQLGIERAARFISFGSNPESEGWRTYVASEIMSLK